MKAKLCDQCRTVGKPDDATWLKVSQLKVPERNTFEVAVFGPVGAYRDSDLADMCSWKCVADYATLKALDPAPEETA